MVAKIDRMLKNGEEFVIRVAMVMKKTGGTNKQKHTHTHTYCLLVLATHFNDLYKNHFFIYSAEKCKSLLLAFCVLAMRLSHIAFIHMT